MGILREALIAFAFLALAATTAHASATNIYIAQSAAGAANGAGCADAFAVGFFNTAANWGSGASQIGPGTTVHLCGTFTGAAGSAILTVQGSGAIGNPVTIRFESGAVLQAAYMGGNPYTGGPGGITCTGQSYITIDGGSNGLIQNTANGSPSLGYANQQVSTGVYFTCSNFEVKNLTIHGIYVHSEGDTGGSNTADIFGDYSPNNCNIHDNPLIRDAFVGINIGYSGSENLTSCILKNNTINRNCWMIQMGDDGPNSSASGVQVIRNSLGTGNQAWEGSNAFCHQNGMFITAGNSGSSMSGLVIDGNTIASDMCSNRSDTGNNCSAPMQIAGTQSNITIINNVVYFTTAQTGYEAFLWMPTAAGMSGTNVIANNTFDEANAGSGQSCVCAAIEWQSSGGAQTGFNVQNNLFLNFTHEVFFNHDGTNALPTKVTAIDHEGFQGITGKWAHDNVNNQDYSTLSAWQTANSTNSFPGYDTRGYSGSLGLNSSYVPQSGSAVVGLGANLTGLGITFLDSDKAGVARPTSGPWDLGTYQYVSGGTVPAPPTGLAATVR
jgi:hypothetical protein